MLKNITIGQYIPGDTPVHRLDPRTKILCAFFFIIALFFVKTYTAYGLVLLFILTVTMLAQLKIQFLYKGLKGVFVLIVFTGLLNLFVSGGTGAPLFSFGFLRIYREGVNLALFMTLRLVFLILGTSLLTLTTSPIELTDGLEKLFSFWKRFGFPAHELAMMMSIALRFIPTLLDETDKIMKAQRARGADFDSGGLVKKAKSLIPILVPLFISSFRRASDLAMAMEARCYRGGEGRTRMKRLAYARRDAIGYTAFLLFVGGIVVLSLPALGLP
ncbi:ECF transporter [Clostridiaceae bacterium JG1575]|nr:ECF transporter [Clostridiaceae bacterium JG1575]